MGDSYPTIRAAAVQAAPVFLDREATTTKACALIREAGRGGAQLIAFPEGFIPTHPLWFGFYPATGPVATRMSVELFKNAVEIPGPELALLSAAARDAGAYVVIGVCERLPDRLGTLFNTQIFIGPRGEYLGKHQKLMPTGTERLVHTTGAAETLGVVASDFGPISGLICGENTNPLAVFALTAEGTRIHVMSWPYKFGTGGEMHTRVIGDSQAFAQVSKAYVVSACATVDDGTVAALGISGADAAMLRGPDACGGSAIVSPDLRVIAGPMGTEEGILYADLDLEVCIRMKLRHDFAGHYNRPDVFQLRVAGQSPRLYERGPLGGVPAKSGRSVTGTAAAGPRQAGDVQPGSAAGAGDIGESGGSPRP